MPYRVGCVPFVNAKPLVAQFSALGSSSPVLVDYEIPSLLPAMLDSGRSAAVLASSFDALATPDRVIAEGVCIGSDGPADSVRLFSKVPFESVSSVALDRSSLTSNGLALGLLNQVYGVQPTSFRAEPDLVAMLDKADAAVLIGDIGMHADGTGLHVLDLGEAWTAHTGLPFVWAVWIGGAGLDSELAGHLKGALDWYDENQDQVIVDAVASSGWEPEVCRQYLTSTMRYRLTDQGLEGLRAYRQMLLDCGLLDVGYFPAVRSAEGS